MLTAMLLLISYAGAHGQDAPFVPPRKPSPVADRLRQQERTQLALELGRNASPQIALYADVFSSVVTYAGDSNPFSPGNPRSAIYTFTAPANVSLLLAEVVSTSASDLDLFVGVDRDLDGQPDAEEMVCYSISAYSLDWCIVRRPVAAQYWVVAFNYRGGDAPPDSFRIDLNAFGPEVKFTSSAALEAGKYVHIGETVTFTIYVQPPLPRSTPISYTLTNVLPDGLQRVVADAAGAARTPDDAPIEWSFVTSGEAVSLTYQAIVAESVALDVGIANRLTYIAGDERHSQATTDLYVLGVALQITATGAPTAPLGATAPFTVTVANQGVLAAENLTVTVDLPSGVEHVSGGTWQDGRLLWRLDRLDGGASVELAFGLRLAPETTSSLAAPAPTARIVGGEEAVPGAWPWQVALWRMDYGQWSGCGGSLIGRHWVLTAAHCVTAYGYVIPASSIGAAVGRHHLYSTEGYIIGASEVLVHPLFDEWSGAYDVALLRLASPAPLGGNIAVAPLATVTDAPAYAAGAAAFATGWGTRMYDTWDYPSGLHQVEVQMYSDETCRADYTAIYGYDVIDDSMICAGVPAGGKDTCNGDSGGPLVVRKGEAGWIQVGITSWGYQCAVPNAPGIYSRVPSFIDWIKHEMRTVRLAAYAVTDGVGLPGHAAIGSAPVVTTFTEVFTSVWVPIVAAGSGSQR
jgi:uncharacterized repeat protein (TIGR01451 family)